MFGVEKTALLRAVLDEVCEDLPKNEMGLRAHVAIKILEAAKREDASIDTLRSVGRKALNEAPTMWH